MDIEIAIKNIISEILAEKDLIFTEEIDLEEYLDSIMFIQLIVRIEEEFGIEYPLEKMSISESNTINKIIDVIKFWKE